MKKGGNKIAASPLRAQLDENRKRPQNPLFRNKFISELYS